MTEKNFKQWRIRFLDGEYEFANIGPGGVRQFYMVVPGQYGQPIIVAEPDLAFDAPGMLDYIDAEGKVKRPDEKIAGIICKDGLRASITSAGHQGIKITVNDDGSIQVGDEAWWIATLFSKDKNRIVGYDAYLVRDRPESVRILELGDLDLF